MNTRVQKIARLQNKEYRDAFVASQINIGIPFQVRALREQVPWKQSELAERAGMLQPRISAIETPGGAKFTLETLRRLASAFDVALIVKFAPFSELLDQSEDFNPDTFTVPRFKNDAGLSVKKMPESETAITPLYDDSLDATDLPHQYPAQNAQTASNVIMFPRAYEQGQPAVRYAQTG